MTVFHSIRFPIVKLTAKVCLGAAAITMLTGWAPTRDYQIVWVVVPGLEPNEEVSLSKGESVALSRIMPEKSVVTLMPLTVEKRNSLPANTVLVQLDDTRFTACEMQRPKGHESFYCFVDQDQDGRFEGYYHLFSHSYFLIDGWTNRAPKEMAPIPYRPTKLEDLHEYIEIRMRLVRTDSSNLRFSTILVSREREDFWVFFGDVLLSKERAGVSADAFGAQIRFVSDDTARARLLLTRPVPGSVMRFDVPKVLKPQVLKPKVLN